MFARFNSRKDSSKKHGRTEPNAESPSKTLSQIANNSMNSNMNKFQLMLSMYLDKFYTYISKGGNVKRQSNIGENSFQLEKDRVYTLEWSRRSFLVKYMPQYVDYKLKGELMYSFHKNFPNGYVIISVYHSPFKVRFGSQKMLDDIGFWERRYYKVLEDNSQILNNMISRIRDTQARQRNNIVRMMKSFEVFKEQQSDGEIFSRSKMFIDIFVHDDALVAATDFIHQFFAYRDIQILELKERIGDYFKAFSPASLRKDSKFRKIAYYNIISTRDEAKLSDFSQGLLGMDKGIYVGTDVRTQRPVYISYTSSAKAQNILICAKTGEGKSFQIKCFLLFHYKSGHRIAIMDYEGSEYDSLVQLMHGTAINLTGSNCVCVNTLVIQNVKNLSQEDAIACYDNAISNTIRDFLIMIDADVLLKSNPQLVKSCESFFGFGLVEYYQHLGIDRNNPSSYMNSQSANYFDLFNRFEEYFFHNQAVKEIYGEDTLKHTYMSIREYWSKTGSKRYMFSKFITIDDIKNSQVLQFKFRGTSTSNSRLSTEELLHLSSMINIFDLYNHYNKSLGVYTAELVEEFQRSQNSPMFVRAVNEWLTGGRKLNLISYIITNSASAFLNSDDANMIAIKESITTKFIGFLAKSGREAVCKAFDLKDLTEQIDDLAINVNRQNQFLMVYDVGNRQRNSGFVQIQVPKDIADSPIFATRRVENYD